VEWVDGADPDDSSASPNFGWFNVKTEPRLDRERLVVLLREVADSIAEEVNADLSNRAED
jgi:predicted GNAT superfamily acetyltransferase